MHKRVLIEIEADMSYFKGIFYNLKRDAHVEQSTHFKEMQHSFQRSQLQCLKMW
jgi:hypothetical protein